MQEKWKKVSVHKELVGCKISEFHKNNPDSKFVLMRFTATIQGWRNWKIAEGRADKIVYATDVLEKVRNIRDRIDAGDDSVFECPNGYKVF